MNIVGGRVVQTPTREQPYKVVLDHGGGVESEHAVATVREGEALIRKESPPPREPETLRDGIPGLKAKPRMEANAEPFQPISTSGLVRASAS